jgi:putative FmdB family regulatory protein
MPLFDFKCNTCNEVVEVSENVQTPCGTCGETMQRVWSPVGVKFNGSGFYSTDNPR